MTIRWARLMSTAIVGAAGEKAGIGDVLDAAVAAWTAWRVAHGRALHMPEPSETFSDGLACAIWI